MACQDGVFNTLVYRSCVVWRSVMSVTGHAAGRQTLIYLLSACPTSAVSAYIQAEHYGCFIFIKALICDTRDASAPLRSSGY